MMQNMNMMANFMQIQNLMNTKNQLTFIESQFNLLLTNMQNMGIAPNSYLNLSNISFQFINFGIQLLNLGIQCNNDLANSTDIKSQLEESIKNLEDINQKYYYKSKFFYNVIFDVSDGQKYLITCESNNTVDCLIKGFLKKVGRYDLFDMEDKVYFFIYNSKKFNSGDNKLKKLHEIFNDIQTHSIFCKIIGQ